MASRRKDLDAALRELEDLRAVFDASPIMFWYKDRNNVLVRVNAAAAALEGATPAAIEGRSGWDLYPKEQADAYYRDDMEVVSTGRPKLGIIEPHTAIGTGELRWLSVGKVPIHGPGGGITGVLAFAIDMTEQRRLEDRLKRLYERTPAMLHSIDGHGHLLTVSDAWLERLGYTRAEVIGRPSIDFLTDSSREYARETVLPAFFAEGRCDRVPYQMETRTGEVIDVLLSGILERDESGAPERSMAVIEDVTMRLRAERALEDERNRLAATLRELAESHELLRVTLESIGDAVITTDALGLVRWLNPVAERMTGWKTLDAAGRPLGQVFNVVHEETRQPADSPVTLCLSMGRTVGMARNTLLIARDGTEFGIEDSASPIRDKQGRTLGAVLVFHDVTEQRRLSGEMSWRASHDALTGLVNRPEFELRLRHVLEDVHQQMHALLYIDLDQFKLVNDACGHSVGDQLLQQVSKVLGDCVRGRDTLARLGGDEFGVILEFCPLEAAQRVAQHICDRMEEFRFVYDGRSFRVGASIGLVPLDDRWAGTASVLQAADTACYAAKEAGRNRVHVWMETDRVVRARQGEMQWANRLAQALDEDRFELFAQRIVPLGPLEEEEGLHCELLLRLREPDGSLVTPGAFLPAAERFHLASRIDRWVLRHAIERLQQAPCLDAVSSVAINLSGQSIGDRAFHRFAESTLRNAGFDTSKLCFEITETAAITNLADATVFIEEMRGVGVRIALDDFGAGASSFGYLKVLPVDQIKIDGQFVRDLVDDPLDAAAVRCFQDVARVVGVRTVAEWVERPDVLERLREMGVDYAQGRLLHSPESFSGLLACDDSAPLG